MRIEGNFHAASSPTCVSPMHYVWDVPNGWRQGRGAFGGLVLAAMLRTAMHAAGAAANPLRSLTGELIGAVEAGPATLTAELLRAGQGLTAIAVRLEQATEVRAYMVALLGRVRDPSVTFSQLPTCVVPSRQTVPVLPVIAPIGPEFAQYMEYAPVGPLPFTGADDAVGGGFVRAKEVGSAFDAPYLVGLADAYWPTLVAKLTSPRPIATVSFSFQLLMDCAHLDPASAVFVRARALAAADGYVAELRELYSENGEHLLALNEQVFAVIK
jgi:acyl-CoA thioesterase